MSKSFTTILVCLFTIFILSNTFAQEGTVILLSQDFETLNKEEKNFAETAFNQFMASISKDAEISIRTATTAHIIRQIQKESQKELEKGLANTAYENDKRTLAKLSIIFAVKKISGEYQITATISEIEKNISIPINSLKEKKLSELTKDDIVDKFSYDVLNSMATRNFIKPLTADVVAQLLHTANTAAAYEKYIADYTKLLEEADKELKALQNSKADKIAKEDAERALKLKKEMLIRNKQLAEENLRKKQAEDAANAKREKELSAMKNEQQKEFLAKIAELEKKKKEIQRAERNNLSLKKRIDLIEQGMKNLRELRAILDDSIKQSNKSFSAQEEKEIKEIQNREYEMGDYTTINGRKEPTVIAKKLRSAEIERKRKEYEQLRRDAERKMRDSSKASIDDYKAQIDMNIAELQKTVYSFRSIDTEQNYLKLEVDEFDGETYSWAVHSSLNFSDIPNLKLEYSKLPDYEITYFMMTKKNPPTEEDYERIERIRNEVRKEQEQNDFMAKRKEFNTTVYNSNLYFRTSVPYLYSEVSLKVRYDEATYSYIATIVSFAMYKTEDNAKPLLTRNERDFKNDREREILNEKARIAAKKERELKEKKEIERRLYLEKFHKQQRARNTVSIEAGYLNDEAFSGLDVDLELLIGARNFFTGGGLDFMYPYLKDDYYLDDSDYKDTESLSAMAIYGLLGYGVTLGPFAPYLSFAPYVSVGMGGYSFYTDKKNSSYSSSSDYETLKSGFYEETTVGLDLRFLALTSIGIAYKLKYFYGIGFSDCFMAGMTFGLYNW